VNFLAPWYIPLLAGAATIPPLVLLYFLKLKRREVRISSTLLWRRAVEDLHVNSPFQKLRSNLLLFLQLLVLLLAIIAISEPVRSGSADIEQAMVLLIDRSASMAVREDGGQTRLSIAKDEALTLIEQMSTDQRAMVITFADRANVLAPFTDDKESLRRAIESITQSDAAGQLGEAMELAEAYTTSAGQGVETEVGRAHFMLLTDGRLPDAGDVVVQRGEMEVVRIGSATENVGIVDLDVRRNYEKPEQVSVLARVRNFGSQTVTRDISLYVAGVLKHAHTLEGLTPLAAPEQLTQRQQADVPDEGNEQLVAFELTLDDETQIELRLTGPDAFATDDRAYALAAAPRPLTALVVTPGNRYLKDLMSAMPLSRCDFWSPSEYENAPEKKLIDAGRCRYDVVVIDDHSTERLPPGNYIFFGGIPLIDEVEVRGTVDQAVFLDWDETHPILRHVAIAPIVAFSWLDLKLGPQATTLIEATNGPVLAMLRQERHQYLLCAFGFFDETRELLNTNWVLSEGEGLVVFMHNALRYLTGSAAQSQQQSAIAGQPLSAVAKPGVTSVNIRRPDGRDDRVTVRGNGLAVYGQTDRVGIYRLDTGISGQQFRAVNLLDEQESFITPNHRFQIAAGQLNSGQGLENLRRPLWPYVLIALGAILLFEWFIYNKRVFI